MKTYIVKDTMEAFLTVGTKEYFYGLTTAANVTKNMSQENIKAGLGSKIVGVMTEEDGFDISVTTGIFYAETIELQQGEELKAVADIKIQKVTEDEEGVVKAEEVSVAGEVMELTAGSSPKNAKLQLRTLAYDSETNAVVAEIFYIFDKVAPKGDFNHDFGMGTNNVQEIGLTALIPKGAKSYGRYVIVPVEAEGEYPTA